LWLKVTKSDQFYGRECVAPYWYCSILTFAKGSVYISFFLLKINPDIQFISMQSRLIQYVVMFILYVCFLKNSPTLNYCLELKVSITKRIYFVIFG
jgi:hypothetical protein